MSEGMFQLLSVIGTIGAAGGTIAASGIALWLAHRSSRVRLKCKVGIHQTRTAHGGVVQKPTYILAFEAANLGERPATIRGIGWRCGRGRRCKSTTLVPITTAAGFGDQLPKIIHHGEVANFVVCEASDRREVVAALTESLQPMAKRKLTTLRGEVRTTIGRGGEVRLEKGLMRALMREVNAEH